MRSGKRKREVGEDSRWGSGGEGGEDKQHVSVELQEDEGKERTTRDIGTSTGFNSDIVYEHNNRDGEHGVAAKEESDNNVLSLIVGE